MVVGHQNFINTKVGYGTKSVEKHRLHGIKAVKKYSKRKRKVNFLSLHDKLTIYSLSLFNKCLFLDFMQMNINSKLNVYCYFSTLHEKQHSSYNFFFIINRSFSQIWSQQKCNNFPSCCLSITQSTISQHSLRLPCPFSSFKLTMHPYQY